MVAEVIFITCVVVLVYTHVGYPALVYTMSRFFGRAVQMGSMTPRVSVIIAARNEAHNIAAKIENTLVLEYPSDRLEVIVASDCSMDETDAIVQSFAARGVVLHRQRLRCGKTAAQNQAVQVSSGDIIVFSDATTRLRADAISRIVRSFADPEVGCVAGQLTYMDQTDSGVGLGCRSYWDWEKTIRESESRLGSMIGVSGCFYAVRRSCYPRLPEDMIDDFVIASEIHLQGLRTVYDSEALAMEETQQHGGDEFRMRVRVIEQSLTVLCRYWKPLSGKWDMFRFQLVSHKWLRYLAPCFLCAAYVSNLLIAKHSVLYAGSFAGMTLFVLSAVAGWRRDRLHLPVGPLAIPYYFCLSNLAAAVALMRLVRGDSRTTWEPVRGLAEPSMR